MRRHLTYANIAATLAVVLAIGAGGYAVGAVPDRDGRITACYLAGGKRAGDVRLLAKGTRCRSGERKVSWNQRGPAGIPGAAGPAGAQGAPGPAGPSEAFNQGLFAGSPGADLQSGHYVVQAIVQARNTTDTALDVTCTLSIGTTSDPTGVAKDVTTVTLAPGAKAPIPLQQIHWLTSPGPANVSCDGGSWNGMLVVLQVGMTREI